MWSFFLRRIRSKASRGAVLVVMVPTVVLAIGMCALGVDLGRIALEKRTDQNVADLAALDAARAVGSVLNTVNPTNYDAVAQSAAVASAVRNEFTGEGKTVTATVGSMDASNNFVPTGHSAVRVVTTSFLDHAFAPGGRTLTATGVAYVGSPTAAFAVGTTLANLDTSKSHLDPMLRTWLGSGSLSAVSYDGLAGSNLSLTALQAALIAQGLTVGTTEQLLDQSLTVGQLFQATASALTSQGKNVAAAEVTDLINASITTTATVKLSDLLDVAAPSNSAALAAEFNVFQLVVGSAQAANGSNFVSVPLTGVNLGPLTGVTLSASVIEPAQTAIGPVGSKAQNSQVALRTTVDVPLGGLLPVVNVTLTYTTAATEAVLTSIVCGAAPSISVSNQASAVSVSGIGATSVGNMNITGAVAQSTPTSLSFSHPTEFSPTYVGKHVGATNTGVALATVNVTGSGATAALVPLLETELPARLATLDAALAPLIRQVLQQIGVQVAQTDVTALGIYPSASSCGGQPRLAK